LEADLTAAAPRTRLVCTLMVPTPGGGRPQDAADYVDRLVAAGMDCARINLSHVRGFADFAAGRAPRYEREEAMLRRVRDAAAAAGPDRHVATLLDVQGVKVRLHLPEAARLDGVAVAAAETIRVRITRARPADELSCDGPPSLAAAVAEAVAARGEIETAIGDGEPMLVCTAVEGDVAVIRAPEAGTLVEGRGVTFRHAPPPDEPPLTPKDRVDLAAFAVPAILAGDADFVALSFAHSAASVRRLREFCAAAVAWFRDGARPADAEDAAVLAKLSSLRPDLAARYRAGGALRLNVCAKIETERAVAGVAEILREADCVMIARGDLGLHCAPQDVPRIQKDVLRRARLVGREGVVATQMLGSMEHAPEPTRAEASDVFNAVLDGADALLLSGETAMGVRPAAAAAMLGRIIGIAEEWEASRLAARSAALAGLCDEIVALRRDEYRARPWLEVTDRLTFDAVRLAESLGARAIVAATRSGETARLIARFDPCVALVAVVPDAAVARRLALTGSVRPLVAPASSGADAVDRGIARALAAGFVARGDRVVVAAARPGDPPGATTCLEVRVVA
jgi:pyruvate kinase